MRLTTLLAFVLGVCVLQQQASLPSSAVIASLASGAALVLFTLRMLQVRTTVNVGLIGRFAALIAISCLGFGYAAVHATLRMSDELAFDDEGRDVAIEGTIASLPVKLERGVRFEFDVERVISPEV
ncbi:MAG: DUF4131 domain-containing protein, partial [Burkholderiaceae bacterium]